MIILEVKGHEFAEESSKWAAIVLGREKPYRLIWEKIKQTWKVKA